MKLSTRILSVAALFLSASLSHAATAWTEGTHYFAVVPARATGLPKGKVEVTEVFSYGCPACNQFVPVINKLKAALPANAVLDYVPAAFNPSEDWPMFQLAFLTAQTFGVAEKVHEAMFDAVWKTGELAILDASSQHLKSRLPTIEDAASFYHSHAGVPTADFLAAAKSFSVDRKVRDAEATVQAYRVDRTPTLVVNGKYRLHVQSAGGTDELIELVKWLVQKESQ